MCAFWNEYTMKSWPMTQIFIATVFSGKYLRSMRIFTPCHQINSQHEVQTLSHPCKMRRHLLGSFANFYVHWMLTVDQKIYRNSFRIYPLIAIVGCYTNVFTFCICIWAEVDQTDIKIHVKESVLALQCKIERIRSTEHRCSYRCNIPLIILRLRLMWIRFKITNQNCILIFRQIIIIIQRKF